MRPFLLILGALLVVFVHAPTSLLRCQTLILKNFTTRDGLPDSRVAPIEQDRRGYIWCGTQAGLTRYDGSEFQSFGPAREIQGIFGRSILEDHTGAHWLAYSGFARGGIARIEDSVTIDCTNGLMGVQVAQVAEDSAGDFWAATSAGLERIHFTDPGRKSWVVTTIPDSSLMMVHAYTGDRIIFAASRGLFMIEGGKIIPLYRTSTTSKLWQVRPHSFYVAHDGSLWLGSFHGAFRISRGRLRRFTQRDGLPEKGVWCFCEDLDGTFFVGAMNGLYRCVERSGTYRFEKESSFGDDVVYDMKIDREGNLWFASPPGLRRLIRSAKMLRFAGERALANAGIGPIACDDRGAVYFGSRNNGLYLEVGGRSVHLGGAFAPYSRTITSVLPFGHRQVWLAFWRTGIELLSIREQHVLAAPRGALLHDVNALEPMQGYGIVAGTSSGAALLDNGGRFRAASAALAGSVVFDLKRGPGDTIWAGTSNGGRALCVRESTLVQVPEPDVERETSGRMVYAVLADSHGSLWFGTDGEGVIRRDQRGITRFTSGDGLAGNRIFALAEDSLGEIWIGTSSGLTCFDGRGYRNLGYDQGFGEISMHGLLTDREGSLWVSAYPGVKKLRPVQYLGSTPPPPLYLTDVQVDARHVSPLSAVTLPPNPAVITFRFTALSYSDERLVRYRYRLDGFDREWSQPERAREVRYTHLPPGEYIFEVLGRSGEGVWNDNPAVFSFMILPPVWARWWFIATVFAGFVGAAYAFYRYRLSKMLELERTRSRIAMDLHDDIGSSLTRISVMTDVAVHRGGTDLATLHGYLASIGETSRDLIESLSDIVWTVDPRHDDLQGVIRRISQFGEEMCGGKGIEFETDLAGSYDSTRLTPEAKRDIYLVFKEGIHNIVKHSRASRARFRVSPTPRGALLELLDDGIGIADGADGKGHGLSSVRERGRRVSLQFSIATAKAGGTQIRMEVKTV